MPYSYGMASKAQCVGVDPGLVEVATKALQISWENGMTDWTIYDGIRTYAEQVTFVARGVSKTMHSKHLDGEALDLVPWIVGKPRWYWPQIYEIAACMRVACVQLAIPVRWGCVWDRRLNDLCPGANDIKALPDLLRDEGLAYNARHPKKDFPDGPHFERIV